MSTLECILWIVVPVLPFILFISFARQGSELMFRKCFGMFGIGLAISMYGLVSMCVTGIWNTFVRQRVVSNLTDMLNKNAGAPIADRVNSVTSKIYAIGFNLVPDAKSQIQKAIDGGVATASTTIADNLISVVFITALTVLIVFVLAIVLARVCGMLGSMTHSFCVRCVPTFKLIDKLLGYVLGVLFAAILVFAILVFVNSVFASNPKELGAFYFPALALANL